MVAVVGANSYRITTTFTSTYGIMVVISMMASSRSHTDTLTLALADGIIGDFQVYGKENIMGGFEISKFMAKKMLWEGLILMYFFFFCKLIYNASKYQITTYHP